MIFILLLIISQLNGQIVINEILASNLSYQEDAYGEYDDLIELYNSSDETIDLTGYFFSDDQNDLTKWVFPRYDSLFIVAPGGYVILWVDGEPFQGVSHLPFSLSKDGESVFLIGPDGNTIIDQKTFPKQLANISYGRDASDNSTWFYFVSPTIGGPNSLGSEGILELPTIMPEGGFFTQPFSVSMINNNSEGEIYFTLNGDMPDTDDMLFEDQINISNTTVLNGRAFKNNFIPSYSNGHLYLMNETYSLPVLAVLSDPVNFWSDSVGIYTNYLSEGVLWERRNKSQYFSNDSILFSNASGIRIQGRSSRVRAKKSFRLFYKSSYDLDRLVYPLFDGEGPSSFKNLVLRSGYDDDIQMSTGTLIRDPLISELWERLGMLTSRSIFSNLFINDHYWGIYNIRESVNEHFISDHTGYLDFDLIRYLKYNIDLKFGTLDEWYSINSFIRENDFSITQNFEEILNRIDMENFLNLQAMIICAEYRSWGWGVSAYREKTSNGKWKWTIWDMDRAFTNPNWNGFTFLNDTTGLESPNAIAFQLLKNDQFKIDYINRISDFYNTLFKPEDLITTIDSIENIIEVDIAFEAERWNRSVTTWRNNVESLRSFAINRPSIVKQQMINYFSLDGSSETILSANEGGAIRINSITISDFPFSGSYFKNIPISIEAMPSSGYVFERWVSDLQLETNPVTINFQSDTTYITAIFSPIDINTELEVVTPATNEGDDLHPLVFKYYEQGKLKMDNDPIIGNLYVNDVVFDSAVVIKKGVGTYLLNKENFLEPIILNIEINNELSNDIILSEHSVTNVDTISGTISNSESIWAANSNVHINGDLLIDVGSHLTINAGAQVTLGEHVNIVVNGQLSIKGEEDDPIIFKSKNWEHPWGGIEFYNSSSSIEHCFFINAGSDPDKGWAHTNTQPIIFAKENSNINIKNSYILYSPGKALGSHTSRVYVDSTVISFVFHGGEFHYSNLIFDHSYVLNIPNDNGIYADDDNDGFHIDYRHPQIDEPSEIRNSFFIMGKDDAIDHHNARVNVENVWIEDWINEGVAASGGDTITITNTIATGCAKGFEAGHGSPLIIIDHSMAMGNAQGFRFGDSYSTPNTGKMIVTNSIAYNNSDNIRNHANHLSGPYPGGIDITFSLTNDIEYDSISTNLTGVPLFNSNNRIHHTSIGSSMGTRGKNFGIIDTAILKYGQVIINEIMYKSSSDFDSEDWIELVNPSEDTVNVFSWILKDDDNDHIYVLPDSIVIPGNGFLVISKDMEAFHSVYNHEPNITGDVPYGFGQGDQVRVYSAIMMLVDSVQYESNDPWPSFSNNFGPSLELINFEDNLLPQNWSASVNIGGTPGLLNSSLNLNILREPFLVPSKIKVSQNYPNPFNPTTTIFYSLLGDDFVNVTIYDLVGRIVKVLVNSKQSAGNKFVIWNATNEKNEPVSSGVYFFNVRVGQYSQTKKMMVIK